MLLMTRILAVSALLAGALFAQNDRGTITGEVKDQAGAVVPGATVVAKNTGSATESRTTTTGTGNYTLPALPAGMYTLTVEMKGFKKFVQQNIQVQVSITNRVDTTLEVGASSETVTITAEAAQLKTESAEQSTVISTDTINGLPLNFGGGGGSSGNIRSPFAFNILSPGVAATGNASGDNNVVNGQTTFRIQIEGQDATSQNEPNWTNSMSHSSVDAIEEFSLQTSNFAAEFSQVGGGFYNFTTRSGTNQFHGSGYEYLTNEALNAYRPYFTPTVPTTSPRSRKHDFGATIGGPVWIPKIYNGRNKTFFFFSEEVFRNVTYPNGSAFLTFPTTAMRAGNFSSNAIYPGQNLGTDPGGNALVNGGIYDPATRVTLPNGTVVSQQFPGNIIPQSRMDPIALKVQNLIPLPTNGNQTNNWVQTCATPNNQQTPTIKIDQILPDNSKLSFYFNKLTTNQFTTQNCMPYPVAVVRVQAIYGTIPRINYDKSITPTVLIHAGLGYQRFHNPDSSPAEVLQYDAVGQLGIKGSATNPAGFPEFIFNGSGEQTLGPTNANSYYDGTLTAVATATWVHGNHTSKIGGEWRLASWTDRNSRGSQGVFQFQANETANPYNNTTSVNGNGVSGGTGNSYASFLLGQIDTASVNSVQDPQLRRQSYGLFIQDTWKLSHKLTLDYGLRWDWQDWGHEIHYRWTEFGPTVPNPVTGNTGAILYSGYGAGRCNCTFSKAYPYSIAPRIGLAYQYDQKTVVRGGVGVSYAPIGTFSYITNASLLGVGYNNINFPSAAFGLPGTTLGQGLVYAPGALTAASLAPGLYSAASGAPSTAPFYIDPNAGRAPRILQWSFGIEREISHNFVVEANYVGNRGAWLTQNNTSNNLDGGLNTVNPASFSKYGIDPTTTAGQTTLGSTIGSAAGKASGVPLPYPNFPLTQTVLQALLPFPQNSNKETIYGAPLGQSWYNSLQMKGTQRLSHGLSLQTAFTWSKSQTTLTTTTGNIFNRGNFKSIASTNQPIIFNTGFTYQLQKYGFLPKNKWLQEAVGGWNIGGLLLYTSGLPIATPASSNTTFQEFGQSSFQNRVAGQPLYLTDPNCHCINPTGQFILNPAAWANPTPGTWGTSAPFYSDFRQPRRPAESMSIGRTFRLKERKSLEVRAEFFNIFNRVYLNTASSGSPQANRGCTITTPTAGLANSVTVPVGSNSCPAGYSSPSGFGSINYTSLAIQPRNGQIVARITF